MASILQKIRKKMSSDESLKSKKVSGPASLAASQDQTPKPPQVQLEGPTELPSPTQPVEIDSIFSGLQLNAHSVESGSPYLQRKLGDLEPASSSNESSSPILEPSTKPVNSSETELKSPFGFITDSKASEPQNESQEETSTSGFGFIEAMRDGLSDGQVDSATSGFSFLQESVTSNSHPQQEDSLLMGEDVHTDSTKPASPSSNKPSSPTVETSNDSKAVDINDSDSKRYLTSTSRKSSGTLSPLQAAGIPGASPPPRFTKASQQHVGRQQPRRGKKKDRKVVRPGHAAVDDSFSSLSESASPKGRDPDSLSIGSQTSSVEGSKDSVSISSSTSELHKLEESPQTDPKYQVTEVHTQVETTIADEDNRPAVETKGNEANQSDAKDTSSSRDSEIPSTKAKEVESTDGRTSGTTGGRTSDTTGGRTRDTTGGRTSDTTGGRTSDTTGGHTSDTTGGRTSDTTGGHTSDTTGGHTSDTTGGRTSDTTGGRTSDTTILHKTEERQDAVSPPADDTGMRTDEKREEPSDKELLAEVFTEPGQQHAVNYEVDLTVTDRLTALLQSSDSNLSSIRLAILDLRQEQTKTFEEHLTTARQQIEKRSHMKELKGKEAKALSEEDYELAEELNQEQESISLEQEWTIAANSQNTLQEWMKHHAELMESEVSLQENIQKQLDEIQEEQNRSLAQLDKEFSSLQAKEKMHVKTMEDKVERERGHIALDREHLEKREQLLQDEIDRRSAEFVDSKKRLQEEHDSVQLEVAALERKLAGLREKGKQILMSIAAEEEKIAAVHEELSGEDGQLAEERGLVARQEAQLQKEVDSLNDLRTKFERTQEKQETKKKSIVTMIETAEVRMTDSKSRTHALRQCLKLSETLIAMDTTDMLKSSEQLHSIQEKYRSQDGEMKELTSRVLSLQSDITSLKKKITDSEAQLSQLQEAKKAAVAARQYKEAARISSEMKTLSAILDSEREKVRQADSELATGNEQLSIMARDLGTIREDLERLEREEDMEHIKHLAKSMAVLKGRMASIPGTDTPLHEALQYWCNLQRLLALDLCAKHDLQLDDFAEETVEVEPESDQNQSSDKTLPQKERTPGVGMELDTTIPSGDTPTEPKDLERIALLEAQIEEACKLEDYDLAAELNDQLDELQKAVGQST